MEEALQKILLDLARQLVPDLVTSEEGRKVLYSRCVPYVVHDGDRYVIVLDCGDVLELGAVRLRKMTGERYPTYTVESVNIGKEQLHKLMSTVLETLRMLLSATGSVPVQETAEQTTETKPAEHAAELTVDLRKVQGRHVLYIVTGERERTCDISDIVAHLSKRVGKKLDKVLTALVESVKKLLESGSVKIEDKILRDVVVKVLEKCGISCRVENELVHVEHAEA